MGQEKMMSSHNKMNDGAKKGDFLGQEKLMLSHNETNYRTKPGHFLGQEKMNYIITR